MAKREIKSEHAPRPVGAYSQVLRVGDFVIVSGQGPVDPTTGEIGQTIEEQTAQTLHNIQAILAAEGATLNHVVKSTVHLADLDLFYAYDRVYQTYFQEPRPTRTTVVSGLMGVLVEIDVTAYLGS